MENTTSNSYQMTFYNIQPISYSLKIMKLIHSSSIKKSIPDNYVDSDEPLWLRNFKNIGNSYQSFISIKANLLQLDILKDSLNNKAFYINNSICLVDIINEQETNVVLLYDYLTHCFNLLYKITILTDKDNIDEIIQINNKQQEKYNLYNVIRKLMVRETNDSIVSEWAKVIENNTIITVKEIITEIFKINELNEQDVFIQTNTGNITNFATKLDGGQPSKDIVEKMLNLNHIAERLDYNSKPIILKDGTVYSFNGRFHTIILQKQSDQNRFLPIQFQMQYLWMYTTKMYQLMDIVNRELTKNNSIRLIKNLNKMIDNIILKVQYLSLFHSNFKRALESDYINVYLKIEKFWNIDDTLNGTTEYISHFKDYLSRNYLRHTERSNSRQNRILYLISMLQFISLIGVWSSYISLTDSNSFDGQYLITIFGNKENLIRFNIYLPLIFFFFIVVLLFSGFVQKRKF